MKIEKINFVPIAFHTRGSREPLVFADPKLLKANFIGEAGASLWIMGKEICLAKGGTISIGSSEQKDDIYIKSALSAGQVIITECEREILVRHHGLGSTLVFDKADPEPMIVDDRQDGILRDKGKIKIKINTFPGSISIGVLLGDRAAGKRSLVERRPAIAAASPERLIQQREAEEALRSGFESAATVEEVVVSYRLQLKQAIETERWKKRKWNSTGNKFILHGLLFGTGSGLGSLFEALIASGVRGVWTVFGAVATAMVSIGGAIRLVNPHKTGNRILSIKKSLQEELIDHLSEFSDQEIAKMLNGLPEDEREGILGLIEENIPQRYIRIGVATSELLSLEAGQENPALPPKSGK